MTSEIKIKRTIIRSDYTQMHSDFRSEKLTIQFADKHSDDWVRFHLDEKEMEIMLRHLLLEDPNPTPKLHSLFRMYPRLHSLLTEALLTFDTEAGGKTMDLQAAPAGKEEQP